jgi:tripartite ATP-independent transporter DctM subunit
LFLNIIFATFIWGGGRGLQQVVLSMYGSIGNFVMSPLPAFILMGEVLFLSEIAFKALNVIDSWMGKLPGRLGIVAVASGTLFAALCGSSVGSTGMLGTALTPEMESRGYGKAISLGPIMGGGGLAQIIPPSMGAVLIGALAEVSVGGILMAGILPGIFLAFLYSTYIISRCIFQPSIAPSYTPIKIALSEKLIATVLNLLPFSLIIFAVMGCIFLGIATPTESAAMGAIAAFVLAVIYRKFSWNLLRKSAEGTVRVAAMVFMIIGGALAFSQILVYTGATQGLIQVIQGLELPPIMLVGIMMILVLFMGSFMDSVAIMMITIPIFMPIIRTIGYDPLLFCLLMLVNIETGFLTPPFGVVLFVMKGVAPPDTTTGDIYKAAVPFIICNIFAIFMIMFAPQIALLIPNLMNPT